MTTQPRMNEGFYCLSSILHMEREKIGQEYDSMQLRLMANRHAHAIELVDGTWEYPVSSPHEPDAMFLERELNRLSDLEDHIWAVTVGLEFEELYGIGEMFDRYIVGPGPGWAALDDLPLLK